MLLDGREKRRESRGECVNKKGQITSSFLFVLLKLGRQLISVASPSSIEDGEPVNDGKTEI